MKKLYYLLITLIFNQAVIAQNNTMLSCIDSVENFTLDVVLDEKNNNLTINGSKVSATYTLTAITFMVKIKDETYFHVLNRNNGALMIQKQSDKSLLRTHQCSVTTRKF